MTKEMIEEVIAKWRKGKSEKINPNGLVWDDIELGDGLKREDFHNSVEEYLLWKNVPIPVCRIDFSYINKTVKDYEGMVAKGWI